MATGFPVTTPGTVCPMFMLYVSMIHAIVCSFVFTSGAGISCAGPMIGRIPQVKRRVMRSSSSRDIFFGSQTTPPFAPPYGMFTTAHFHVIHMASALTSSRSTLGW